MKLTYLLIADCQSRSQYRTETEPEPETETKTEIEPEPDAAAAAIALDSKTRQLLATNVVGPVSWCLCAGSIHKQNTSNRTQLQQQVCGAGRQ